MRRRTLGIVLLGASGLSVASGGIAPPVTADQKEDAKQGRLLYGVYCHNCHGEAGRGDGPTARLLTVKPTDLTRISDRNGGEFPAEEVARAIDGREFVQGHGNRKMTIWGLSMQQLDQDSNQEAEVQKKVRQLTRYLQSIQKD